jgi:uncharacterized protein (DUF58 family)
MHASNRFLPPDTAARVRRLELRARKVVEGFLSGLHRSPYFGQSIEFLQHRQYVPGDELRHIDWKVYARQDRLHIKQYEEETNFRCTILVDASASMAYGKKDHTKFDYAAQLAAAFALLVGRQQDAAGLVVFADRVIHRINASVRRNQLVRVLEALDGVQAADATDFAGVLREITESLPKRGVIILLTDLFDAGSQPLQALSQLRARGHDCILIQVLDRDEIDFDFSGPTRFEGLESSVQLPCNPRSLREGYLEALRVFLDSVKQACGNLGMSYHLAPTDRPASEVLAAVTAARS